MKPGNNIKKKIGLGGMAFWKKEDTGLDKREKINVEHQWQIAFVAMALAGVLLIGWEICLFLQIDRNSIFTVISAESVEVDTLDRPELESILQYYKEKERSFGRFYDSGTRYPQPPEQEPTEELVTPDTEEE